MKLEIRAELRSKSEGLSKLRSAGRVPGVLYGAGKDNVCISLSHDEIFHAKDKPEFHGQILDLCLSGIKEEVILRELQRHPFKPKILHVDFLRIRKGSPVTAKIKLRFNNTQNCPAVKLSSAVVSYINRSILVKGLPEDLPEYMDIDLSELKAGQTIHLSDVKIPDSLRCIPLAGGQNVPIAQASKGRTSVG